MKVSVGVLIGLLGLAGCRSNNEPETPKPKPAQQVAEPVKEATPATVSVTPRSVPALATALAKAERCVKNQRLDQGCTGYVAVREAVHQHLKESSWREALLTAASDPGPQGLVALVLFSEIKGDDQKVVNAVTPQMGQDRSPAHREAALRALYTRPTIGLAAKAMELLDTDQDPRVRAAALYLLVKPQHEPDPKILGPKLIALLNAAETPLTLRRAAIGGLGKLRYAKAAPVLAKYLDDERLGPNASVNLAGLPGDIPFNEIYGRVEKAAKGGDYKFFHIAALSRLDHHPRFEPAKAKIMLEALVARLKPLADKGDQRASMAMSMAQRQIARLRGRLKKSSPKKTSKK